MPNCLHLPPGYGDFELRPIRLEDEAEWNIVRWKNREWLAPWESTDPLGFSSLSFAQWIKNLQNNQEQGLGAVFLMKHQSSMVGQISMNGICYGAVRSATVGYWVDQEHIGSWFAPLSLAMLADWAFFSSDGPRLHRIEVDILPENQRSLRVPEKLGMSEEGVKRRYMYIAGKWRDHRSFSLLADEVEGSLTEKLLLKKRDTLRDA